MQADHTPQAVLIGAGIMSATLAFLLKELEPAMHIIIIEKLPEAAQESSGAMHNAGTGHSAYCELNYTPQLADGSIEITKALKIASQFEVSKSLYSYLIEKNIITDVHSFLHQVPHHSFVSGEADVAFLQKRFEAMQQHYLFETMAFTTDKAKLTEWFPLIMQNRNSTEIVAATKVANGTDINYEALTKALLTHLQQQPLVDIYYNTEVRKIDKDQDNNWYITSKELLTKDNIAFTTPFVFIGAGGGSLPLLEEANIIEGNGYGGFPVGGQFLVCTNPTIVAKHTAKVYGKASVGAPPMSVPHLDSRYINGKQALLFGPFAGFSTKFLKHGSYFDLPNSIEFSNIFPMLSSGWHNIPLVKYLVQQVMLTHNDRMNALREYYPNAVNEDWELSIAGQRVQVIKKDDKDGGKLEFGTELITDSNGSLAVLLGASPGASTATSVMVEVLRKCFSTKMQDAKWQTKLKEILPSVGKTLATEKELYYAVRDKNNKVLFGE